MTEFIHYCKDEGCGSRYKCHRFMASPYNESLSYFETMTRKEKDDRCKHFIKTPSFLDLFRR